jgi:hypothetical protein
MEFAKRFGFPLAYIRRLGQSDFELLLNADKALDDGELVEADKSFALLRVSLGGVVNMLKGFLMRFHIGNIHPELSEMMEDPGFVVPDDKARKAQQHVTKLAKQHYDGRKAAGQLAEDRYLKLPQIAGNIQYKNQNEFGGLSIQEVTALVGYLSDLFPNYNNPLRMGIGQNTGNNDFGEENFNLTATAISALNKLPPYGGNVFRHSGIFPGYLEMHQAGAVIPDMAFMSTAKHLSGTGGANKHDVLEVIVDTKTGKDVEKAAWFGNESEVLFKPGTRFRVLLRLNLDDMPGGRWPTEAEAANLGYGNNEVLLLKYLNSDNLMDKIKHVILKKED